MPSIVLASSASVNKNKITKTDFQFKKTKITCCDNFNVKYYNRFSPSSNTNNKNKQYKDSISSSLLTCLFENYHQECIYTFLT